MIGVRASEGVGARTYLQESGGVRHRAWVKANSADVASNVKVGSASASARFIWLWILAAFVLQVIVIGF